MFLVGVVAICRYSCIVIFLMYVLYLYTYIFIFYVISHERINLLLQKQYDLRTQKLKESWNKIITLTPHKFKKESFRYFFRFLLVLIILNGNRIPITYNGYKWLAVYQLPYKPLRQQTIDKPRVGVLITEDGTRRGGGGGSR